VVCYQRNMRKFAAAAITFFSDFCSLSTSMKIPYLDTAAIGAALRIRDVGFSNITPSVSIRSAARRIHSLYRIRAILRPSVSPEEFSLESRGV